MEIEWKKKIQILKWQNIKVNFLDIEDSGKRNLEKLRALNDTY